MKRILWLIYLIGLCFIPIVLMILPKDFFDQGQSICLSVLLLDTTCYGCGITRAVQHLIHLDIESAYAFNKLSFIVLPFLIGVWGREVRRVYCLVRSQYL